jgi:acylglycerol lipase
MKGLLIIFFVLVVGCMRTATSHSHDKESFSRKELVALMEKHNERPEQYIQYYHTLSDNMQLAIYSYMGDKKFPSVILFHGGGAHATAGYQLLAERLYTRDRYNVFMVDLRGHGKSGGRRGDTPTVERLYMDVEEIIRHIKEISNKDIYIAAHSSAAGLLLNYLSWKASQQGRKDEVSGYIFISPEFGYKSETKRTGRTEFARVKIWVFVIAGITKGRIGGNWDAVYFNYPSEVLARDPLLLDRITRNMSAAQTPEHPVRQFAGIDRPFAIFIGSDDELMDPGKVISYADYPQPDIRRRSVARIVYGAGHLSAIWRSAGEIGSILRKWTREKGK